MSNNSAQASQEAPSLNDAATPAKAMAEGLACNGCRKAKLRCSRDRPNCVHCRKSGLECIYEIKRVKPGLKAGAVENLHRRLDALERIVNGRDTSKQSNRSTSTTHHDNNHDISCDSAAYSVLALLAKELPKLIHSPRDQPPSPPNDPTACSRKRSRSDNPESATSAGSQLDEIIELPDPEILDSIISAYFHHIHPWIPMIHQGRFRQRLDSIGDRAKLEVVLHAMIIAAYKFVPNSCVSADILSRTRQWVVYAAMDGVCLESLQALIILAFNDIGSGNAAKAWSIIGSLTRTVEYSQLTQEHEDNDYLTFCRPYISLNNTYDWTELEERRRIFWNVFNLDRFCSVTMGWNTSLTSDDVQRRLPCDGHLWRKRKAVTTPFFGIWDKSAGRIGNHIALNDVESMQSQQEAAASTSSNFQPPDMSTVGAFAYRIEATESMSRVTSYFLQQKINLSDHRAISSWLTRFKELDLRLVHWKMLLPQKWKSNPNLVRVSALMDPNLTLAHVTHNASMILLHQLIAYPQATWRFRNRLPSTCSAEACYAAGIEIATITQNYLINSPEGSPIGSQYAFCVYVAARMLLVHWRYRSENRLADEFWSLVQSLEVMSTRWIALAEPAPGEMDLAKKYATKLRQLYELCVRNESFNIDVMGYTTEIIHENTSRGHSLNMIPAGTQEGLGTGLDPWPSGMSPIPGTVPAVNISIPNALDVGDFSTIPQMTLDQQFMNMDRVIAFDDGSMFAATLDYGAW